MKCKCELKKNNAKNIELKNSQTDEIFHQLTKQLM